MSDMIKAKRIGPLIPFVCDYRGPNGGSFGITLYGTSEEIVIANNRDELPELKVVGTLVSYLPVSDQELAALRRVKR